MLPPNILSDNYNELSNILTKTLLNSLGNLFCNSYNSYNFHHFIYSAPNNSNENDLFDNNDDNGNNNSNNNNDNLKRLYYLKMSSQVPETPISLYSDRQPAS